MHKIRAAIVIIKSKANSCEGATYGMKKIKNAIIASAAALPKREERDKCHIVS